MSTSVISQCEAYSLMLRSYPDIMNINQICEVLCISTKTGYKLLRDGEILSLKAAEHTVSQRLICSLISKSELYHSSRRKVDTPNCPWYS